MKRNNKFAVCAVTAVIGILSAVPVSAKAESTANAETPVNTWQTDTNGRIFYFDGEGNFLTGEQEIDGVKYLFSANGVLKTGWRTVDGIRCYYDPKTGKPVTGWIDYCGQKFYSDAENGKEIGFFSDSENKSYISDEKGSLVTGSGFTKNDDGIYYFNSDNSIATGETPIDGITYSFDEKGRMKTGMVTDSSGNTQFFDENGELKKGWVESDGIR